MAVEVFRSTDGGAPTLDGLAGSLINVLDACLVTGLGWSKTSVSTNIAVYRPAAGVQHYLYINDNAPDASALGRNAQMRGYVGFSGGSGTYQFPVAIDGIWPKSTTANSTARAWLVIGDERTVYFFNACSITTPVLSTHYWATGMMFGEIYSTLPGDGYKTMIFFPHTTGTLAVDAFPIINPSSYAGTTTVNASLARSYSGLGGGIFAAPIGNNWFIGMSGGSSVFPNPVDGGIYVYPILASERGTVYALPTGTSNYSIRGRLRGLYGQIHDVTTAWEGDTFAGTGDYAGKTFLLVKVYPNNSRAFAFETTDWAYSS